MRNFIVAAGLVMLCFGANAAKLTGTLKKIQDTGVFTIGYIGDSQPFSFLNPQGTPVGYSLDLCRRIATATKERLGLAELETKFVELTNDNRFDAVESGLVDIECGTSTITMSRLERVDFTLMTFVTGGSLLSRSDAPVRTADELSGKTVVVIRGTTTETALTAFLSENLIDAKVVTVANEPEGMASLQDGKADAFASDQVTLIGQIIESRDIRGYVLSQDLFSFEPYGLMVRRNDADFRLVANRAIAQIYRTGQFQSLFEKWFAAVGIKPSPVLVAMYKLQAIPE